MNNIKSIAVSLCYICTAVGILSVMLPQKRTRKVMSFVIGLFLISSLVSAVSSQEWSFERLKSDNDLPAVRYSESDFEDEVAQKTADNVTAALKTLLENEGITPDDIQLEFKISEEGRISVVRAVIYIDETYRSRRNEIETIVYRNLSKEPEIYVTGEEARSITE